MPVVTKINKTAVDNLIPEGSRPSYLWDASLPGFGVKCTSRGAKRYVVKYRLNGGGRAAPQRWLTLGSHGQLTPDQARKMAQQALAAVARGEDPQGVKADQRKALTFADLWQRYEVEHLPSKKPQTRRDYEAQWLKVIKPALGRVPVGSISRSEIEAFHRSLRETPYRANRILALISRLMTLAEVWESRPAGSNPCRHIQRFKEKARNRYLSGAEIAALGRALGSMTREGELSPSAANAIRLLLLTGARLNEILSAEWSWVDYDRQLLALPDSKTGEKSVFLSGAALLVLKQQHALSGQGAFLFPGTGRDGRMINLRKPWDKVCDHAGLVGVRLHDLRHTAASIAVGQGASLPIIGRLLGHTQAQTTLRYAHVDHDPALAAANAIGAALEKALSIENE